MGAEIGNKYAKKWDEEKAEKAFLKGLEYAQNDPRCLHLADAIKVTGIPYSTYDYLAETYNVLGLIKKDTKTEVLLRINRGTLNSDYPAAAGIWRMKQLGETDKVEQDIKHSGTGGIIVQYEDMSKPNEDSKT